MDLHRGGLERARGGRGWLGSAEEGRIRPWAAGSWPGKVVEATSMASPSSSSAPMAPGHGGLLHGEKERVRARERRKRRAWGGGGGRRRPVAPGVRRRLPRAGGYGW